MPIIVDLKQDIKNDMNALLNAHTHRGRSRSPHVGLTSNVLPEAQRSQTGATSEYVQKLNHYWFVLRVTFNTGQRIVIPYNDGSLHDVDFRLYFYQSVEIDVRNFAGDVMTMLDGRCIFA